MRTLTVLTMGSLALAACDTGDGTELRDPSPDAPPATDVAIGTTEPSAEQLDSDTLASAALTTVPATVDPAAPTLPAPVDPGGFDITAPWADGAEIDESYGCDGLNAAPPLAWGSVPDNTVELAVVLENESDVSRGQPFIHWIMTGLDPTSAGLAENEIPDGAVLALNFFGNIAYDGPCPPPGSTDVYVLTLFALDEPLTLPGARPAAEVLDAIREVASDQTILTGSRTR